MVWKSSLLSTVGKYATSPAAQEDRLKENDEINDYKKR